MIKKITSITLATIMLLTVQVFAEKSIDSATWQDPQNIILQWQNDGKTYEIHRSDKIDGVYIHMDNSDIGSYRDADAKYPNTYYYKLKDAKTGQESTVIKSGENPQQIRSVYVMMYHHFVSEKDIAEGIEFEEYSLTPEDFEKDLKWLRDNGFTTITSDELLKYLKGEISLPEKAIIISIDDGSWGVYKNAYPLLKQYNMKADLNVIGSKIDETWDWLQKGGIRLGEPAPYCVWEELAEMQNSGIVNICSHSYGYHVYNREGRVGLKIMEGENDMAFSYLMKKDYDLSVSCINGWLDKMPTTVAYPYSRRNSQTDSLILESTGYEILMAGEDQRGSAINHFVEGCDFKWQQRIMSRPCRMDGHPISEYIEAAQQKDFSNRVNTPKDTVKISIPECDEIAKDYKIFKDVASSDWYAGCAYYNYLNGFIKGTSYTEFSPDETINRAMAATLLHRIAGKPQKGIGLKLDDVKENDWYSDSAKWAIDAGILKNIKPGSFVPDSKITREDLICAMYNCARSMGKDVFGTVDLTGFKDSEKILAENIAATKWAVEKKVISGNGDGTLNPKGYVTRAEMAKIIQNFIANIM